MIPVIIQQQQKIKYLGINLIKEVKDCTVKTIKHC